MEPLILVPPCKDYLWGGTRLKTEYGKQSDCDKVAESWELSCHKDGCSVIENGEEAGRTLPEYLEKHPEALGTRGAKFSYFPILIKLIDAHDNLSIQVHPDNDYALRVEGEYGKTEMWYIVDCEPGAELLYGFTHEITREEFRRRIEENTLLEVTRSVPVKQGDVFFIEAGTLHAIGKGILIAEIQQNSNTTYRVYDYGRVGADGKPRALHIDKAAEVTRLAPAARRPGPQGQPEQISGGVRTLLAACEYFTVYAMQCEGTIALRADEGSFQSVLCLTGALTLRWGDGAITLKKGQSVFVPANMGDYTVEGKGRFLLSYV